MIATDDRFMIFDHLPILVDYNQSKPMEIFIKTVLELCAPIFYTRENYYLWRLTVAFLVHKTEITALDHYYKINAALLVLVLILIICRPVILQKCGYS